LSAGVSSAVERCPTGTAVLAAAPQVEWKFSPKWKTFCPVNDQTVCFDEDVMLKRLFNS